MSSTTQEKSKLSFGNKVVLCVRSSTVHDDDQRLEEGKYNSVVVFWVPGTEDVQPCAQRLDCESASKMKAMMNSKEQRM